MANNPKQAPAQPKEASAPGKVEETKVATPPSSPPLARPTLADLQRVARGSDETRINVRLYLDSSDADGVRHFDEALPVSIVRAILDPGVGDLFIPVQGFGRLKPPRAKGHWLHTGYIREVLLLDELPEEENK